MTFKYVRIQGREQSYVTKQPKGVFAMCWRMIYDGIMEKTDAEIFEKINEWFERNLPTPEVCRSGDQAVITYFKTGSTKEMIKQLDPALELLEKYDHPYDVVYTNFVDNIVYEDEYQIAVRIL